jgi:hypothetical protein
MRTMVINHVTLTYVSLPSNSVMRDALGVAFEVGRMAAQNASLSQITAKNLTGATLLKNFFMG